jgi:acyl-CoA thioesterase FadM
MGLVHTPRVIASIAKGLWQRRSTENVGLVGVGPSRPHIYKARAGFFDVDYLGNLSKAAYLTHCEYARWEMTSCNGMVGNMFHDKVDYVAPAATIRFRREVRPLFRQFQIDTCIAGLDEKHIYFIQNFRYPVEGDSRVRAQVLITHVAVQNRQVIDPRKYLEKTGVDPEEIAKISLPNCDAVMKDQFERWQELDDSMRKAAAVEDETHAGF